MASANGRNRVAAMIGRARTRRRRSGLAQPLTEILCRGSFASLTTALTAALCGRSENRNAVGPINAVSHMLWGDRAAAASKVSGKYTLTGFLLNAAAVTAWAGVHQWLFGQSVRRQNLSRSLLGGGVVSALAYVTDYWIVPKRFTPGFEKKLSNRSLFLIYSVLAVSLGAGCLLGKRSHRASRAPK